MASQEMPLNLPRDLEDSVGIPNLAPRFLVRKTAFFQGLLSES